MKHLLLITTLLAVGTFVYFQFQSGSVVDKELTQPAAPTPCGNPDSSILMDLYHALNGPAWIRNTGWGQHCDLSSWYGIRTNLDGRVTEIHLIFNGLDGMVPASIVGLTECIAFNLTGNNISGPLLAEFGNLTKLELLSPGNPGLTGTIPNSFSNLVNLRSLALANNQLSGPIPNFIGDLPFLHTVGLAFNQFSGPIPNSLGNGPSIQRINLQSNLLSGTIPLSLASLDLLQTLQLGNNDLDGTIPVFLENMPNLFLLDLANNNLTGQIPPQLGNPNLVSLTLQGNNLSGEVPASLGTLLSYFDLDFSSNNLEGCLPNSFTNYCGLTQPFFYHDNPCLWQGDFESEFCQGNSCLFDDYTLEIQPSSAVCAGTSVQLIATGGDSYQWSTSETSAEIIVSPVSTSVYYVTITTNAGCERTDSIMITTFDNPVVSVTGTNVSIQGGDDGSASATSVAGNPPYAYIWSTGETSSTISNLTSGTYYVTSSDISGCQDSASIIITEPSCPTPGTPCDDGDPDTYDDAEDGNCNCSGTPCPLISVDLLVKTLDCFQDQSGMLTALPADGQSPYSYLWSTGETGATIMNLDTGTYAVTVYDDHGCSVIESEYVSQPEPLLTMLIPSHESYPGAADGAIHIEVSGGSPPYRFTWRDGSMDPDRAGLIGGGTSYAVTVTDDQGCQATDSIVIETGCHVQGTPCDDANPLTFNDYEDGFCNCLGTPCSPIDIQPVVNFASCYGQDDGSISLELFGGAMPYQIAWSTGDTTENVTQLVAGVYSVTVVDAYGCSAQRNVGLSQADPLWLDLQVDASSWNNSDGSIDLSISGGTKPYQISWSNGSTSEDIDGLEGGLEYSVSVVDANGCIADSTIGVGIDCPPSGTMCDDQNPSTYGDQFTEDCLCVGTLCPSVQLNSEIIHPSCSDAFDGSILIVPSGGQAPYSVIWSHNATSLNLDGLNTGIYQANVMDANGCSSSVEIELSSPLPIKISYKVTAESEYGAQDGKIDLLVSGGTTPYRYQWNNGQTSKDLDSLAGSNQSYEVKVTDALGCQASLTIEVGTNCSPSGQACDDGDSTTIDDQEDGNCHCAGKPCLSPNVTLTTGMVSCHGSSDGFAILSLATDHDGYEVTWSNGSVGDTAAHLEAGSYSVTWRGTNGCQWTDHFLIEQPELLAVGVSIQDESSPQANDGRVTVVPQGGSPPYLIEWSNGDTSATLINLGPQNLTLQIQDNHGCTVTDSITISTICPAQGTQCNDGDSTTYDDRENGECACIGKPCSEINYEIVIEEPNCNGGKDGSITCLIDSDLEVRWSHGPTTAQIKDISAGVYEVTIIDSNDCHWSEFIRVSEPDRLSAELWVQQPGVMSTKGSIEIDLRGGIAPYDILWSTGDTSTSIQHLAPGWYSFTALDANGCALRDSVHLSAGSCGLAFQIEGFSLTDPSSCNESDGTIDIRTRDGASELEFSIDGGVSWNLESTFQELRQGRYRVLARIGGTSCLEEFLIDLGSPLPVVFDQVEIELPSSCMSRDGFIDIKSSLSNVLYSIDDGASWQTETKFDSLSSRSYQIMVRAVGDTCLSLVGNAFDLSVQPDLVVDITLGEHECNHDSTWVEVLPREGVEDIEIRLNDGLWQSGLLIRLTEGHYLLDYRRHGEDCIYRWPMPIIIENDRSTANLTIRTTDPTGCRAADGKILVLDPERDLEFSLNSGIDWQSSNEFTGLEAGVHWLLARVQGQPCVDTMAITLAASASAALIDNETVYHPSCNGGSDGVIALEIPSHTELTWLDGSNQLVRSGLPAGIYQAIVKDSNDCTAIRFYELLDPPAMDFDIPPLDSTPLCQGEELQISLDDQNLYEWYLADKFLTSSPKFTISKAGNYRIVAIDTLGCTLEKSFSVHYSEEVFNANFLISSQVLLNDTVVVVETSWPVPDGIEWHVSDGNIVQKDLNQLRVFFEEVGTYTVTLTATSGTCLSTIAKEIEVVASQDSLRVQTPKYQGFKSVHLFPNPNGGNFNVEVILTQISPLQTRIYFHDGTLVYSHHQEGSETYVNNIDLGRPIPGTYSILLQSDLGWHSLNFIVK